MEPDRTVLYGCGTDPITRRTRNRLTLGGRCWRSGRFERAASTRWASGPRVSPRPANWWFWTATTHASKRSRVTSKRSPAKPGSIAFKVGPDDVTVLT
jgi:hypothetical protein